MRRVFLVVPVLLLFAGCPKSDPVSPSTDSGKIKTGAYTDAATVTVGTASTVVNVDKPGTPVHGLQITVPAGAYTSAKQFKISYADITSHDFGANFHPVTPLLRIENGGEWTSQPMTLHIPLTVDAARGAMAFYYDPAKGVLEGITTVKRGADYIDVLVRHFSLIVVSDFQKQVLIDGGGFHTFFDPQENGWSFVNDGTAVTYGNCAGMSIGAAYFYRDFKASVQIATWFDNNSLWFRTPTIWQDDATALRFVTEVQKEFGEARWNKDGVIDGLLGATDEEHFWNICYGLLTLNQPQPIYVDLPSVPTAWAHEILAFAYEIDASGGRIKVYDPNYPGAEGTIHYDFATKSFQPYTSAANSSALEQGHTFNYTRIRYTPLSTIAPVTDLDAMWSKVAAGTIGKGVLPDYDIYARSKSDPTGPRILVQDVTKQNTVYLPFADVEFVLEPKNGAKDLALATYEEIPSIHEYELIDPATGVEINETAKLIGLWVKGKEAVSGSMRWAGFAWCKLALSTFWVDPYSATGGLNQDIEFTVRSVSAKPAQMRCEWNFGDNSGIVKITGDSTATHKYADAGTYNVTVSVIDASTNQTVAKLTAKAEVSRYIKFMVDLKGADQGDQTSALTLSNGDPLSDVVTSNFGNTVYGPLVWSGTNFSASYSWDLFGTAYTGSVSGSLSADGKRVVSLTSELHGVLDTWSSTIRLNVHDFPIEEMAGLGITGGEISGSAVQAKITDYFYEIRIDNGTGTPFVVTLSSVNWSSPKLRLYVYFYTK